MNPVERGFVVPVWRRSPGAPSAAWRAVWADSAGEWFMFGRRLREGRVWDFLPADQLAPRDPNRADRGDRPDLLEAT